MTDAGAGAYPTNARDLVRVLRESMAVSRGDVLELPPNVDDERSGTVATAARAPEISEAEMRVAIERHRWNQTRAAGQLGITRWALLRLMSRYGLRDAG